MSSIEKQYHVQGKVTGVEAQEISGAEVTVTLQRIREAKFLASGLANEEGDYQISYDPPDDVAGRLFVVVQASSAALRAPIRSAPTEVQPELEIDLQAEPPDTSEFSSLLRAVEPLLDGLKLEDLVESSQHQDITYLAQETGKTSEQIMQLLAAARLNQAYSTDAAAFYAFLRQRVPSSLPSSLLAASDGFTLIDSLVQHVATLIFGLSSGVQTGTLQAAVQAGLISQSFAAQIPAIVADLQSHAQKDALSQPYLAGKTTLGQVLDLAQLAQGKQQAFAKALQENTQPMAKFWATLAELASTASRPRKRRRCSRRWKSAPLSKIRFRF